jgi:hypothetical protein
VGGHFIPKKPKKRKQKLDKWNTSNQKYSDYKGNLQNRRKYLQATQLKDFIFRIHKELNIINNNNFLKIGNRAK